MTSAPSIGLKATRGVRAIDLRRAVDLALAGAIGALCGLYLDVELVRADAVWVRDAWAGLAIGASSGYCLNAASALRDGATLRAARNAGRGAVAGGIGGAIGLVVGEVVLGVFQGGLIGRALSWGVLGLGIGAGLGLAGRSRQGFVFSILGGSRRCGFGWATDTIWGRGSGSSSWARGWACR